MDINMKSHPFVSTLVSHHQIK